MASAPKTPLEVAAAAPAAARGQVPRAELPQPAELAGRLFVRNTFFHIQEHEEEGRSHLLFRSSSAPALLPPPAGLGVPRSEPPSSPGAEWRTTVLFRNVPYLLTRDMLVELLDSHGYRGQFDLVYLPRDFKTNQTLGYSFVNALTPEIAARLFRTFEGFHGWPVKSQKTCVVCWSDRQGLESNVRVYRNLTVMKEGVPEAWKPALFSQGSQVPFPAPTGAMKATGSSSSSSSNSSSSSSSSSSSGAGARAAAARRGSPIRTAGTGSGSTRRRRASSRREPAVAVSV